MPFQLVEISSVTLRGGLAAVSELSVDQVNLSLIFPFAYTAIGVMQLHLPPVPVRAGRGADSVDGGADRILRGLHRLRLAQVRAQVRGEEEEEEEKGRSAVETAEEDHGQLVTVILMLKWLAGWLVVLLVVLLVVATDAMLPVLDAGCKWTVCSTWTPASPPPRASSPSSEAQARPLARHICQDPCYVSHHQQPASHGLSFWV